MRWWKKKYREVAENTDGSLARKTSEASLEHVKSLSTQVEEVTASLSNQNFQNHYIMRLEMAMGLRESS